MSTIVLSRGEKYPLPIRQQEGATADFLRGSNVLQIVMHDMSSKEEKALRSGLIRAGYLYHDGALLWLFQFYSNAMPIFTFDAPFDARLIPRDQLSLHNIENENQRLAIEIHAVDEKNIIRALRLVTLSPKMTRYFLADVQQQLSTLSTGTTTIRGWMQQSPNRLLEMTLSEVIGK